MDFVRRLERLVFARQYRDALVLVQQAEDPTALVESLNARHAVTSFHYLCIDVNDNNDDENDAVALAEAMLCNWPELASAVCSRDADGLTGTALHLCVYPMPENGTPIPRSTKLALLLLRLSPQSVNIVDRQGQTPFHIACWADANIAVLRAMLEINPLLASELAHSSGLLITGTPLNSLTLSWKHGGNRYEDDEEYKYRKAILILKTAFHGRLVDETSTEFLAHAMCSYLFPAKILEGFSKHYSVALQAQLSQRDDKGNLPIHYAVQSVFAKDWEGKEQQGMMDGEKFYWTGIVILVAKQQPRAALVPDGMGKLPLFLALQCTGMSWNWELIVNLARECPQTLYRRDESSMLYPALFAATRAEESDEHLSVAYELLRETPEFFLHAQTQSDSNYNG